MRKFGKESTAPTGSDRESGIGWLQNHCALAVAIVAIIALLLRVVFVYGVSAGAGFALSGGSEAQYHLHVVESILNGSFIFGADAAVNYPIGGLNVNPPLYDLIAAAVGALISASASLAVLAPVFGALTVFPVYLIGKELADDKIGFIAAVIYGLMALPIVSSVFSNGTEYAFVAFLFAFFTLAMIKVVRKINDRELAKKELLVAGILLGLIALSWNGFRAVLVILIVIMVIQMLIDRFNSKDFSVAFYSYSLIMIIGVAMAAIYYVPANLWDAVFSGPALITIIAVAFGFIFKALESKPWIFVIPGLIIAFAVIAVVLYLVAPDYCTALLVGNPVYASDIMNELARVGISMSKMSAYYGWVLMWMPAILGLYEFYVYAMKDRSHTQLFLTMWLLVGWFFSWTSYGAAVVFGSVFAVSSSIVLVKVITKANLRQWVADMKAAGFPSFLRKLIKPLPFLSVLITAFLVVAPGVVNAVDAGISSNEDYGYFGYGNTTFTVATGDNYPVEYVLHELDGLGDDSKAVVSWIDYSADLAAHGYNAVNDPKGAGAIASAEIFLANGSVGANAAQMVRLMLGNNLDFSEAFGEYRDTLAALENYIKNPETATEFIDANPDRFGKVRSDMDTESAVYLVCVDRILTDITEIDISNIYSSMCQKAGNNIGYYVLDASMLPLAYNDGNSLSTIAYFAGYSIDGNGAANQFYSYLTYYSNYPAIATTALYDTFLWKAVIGPTPSDAGYSSSFDFLYSLSSSNGSVKPLPGFGLDGYRVFSWFVKYNPDPKATVTSDGWFYMDQVAAEEQQKEEGGIINYLSSVIILERDSIVGTEVMSGTVVDEAGNPLSGITVRVTGYSEEYNANVLFSECKTTKDGKFSVYKPASATVTFKNGDAKLVPASVGEQVVINSSSFATTIVTGEYGDYLFVLKSGEREYRINSAYMIIDSDNAVDLSGEPALIVPGTYTYELRDNTAASVASGTVTLYPGDNSGLSIEPKAYNVTATVKDNNGVLVDECLLVATNKNTGDTFSTVVKDGNAAIKLPSATYTFSLAVGYITNDTTSLSVTSDKTLSLTAYPANGVAISGAENVIVTATAGTYSTYGIGSYIFLPAAVDGSESEISLYGADAENVYYGKYTSGDSTTMTSGKAYTVTGSIGEAGTVKFITSDGVVITTTAGDDGKFSVRLMAGTYTVWAANKSSNKAYIGTAEITDGKDLGTLTLTGARKITSTYQYASGTSKGNIGIAYTPITASFAYDSKPYSFTVSSDTSGKAVFVLPAEATGVTVMAGTGSIDNAKFKADGLTKDVADGTTDTSVAINIAKENVVQRSVTAPYPMTLKPYSGGDEFDFVGTMDLQPGQYTAKVSGSTGHYFSGTVYLYPGMNALSGLNVVDVNVVDIVKNELDTITVEGDKSYYHDGNEYYFEVGGEFFIKSSNGSTGNVKYGYVNGPVAELDMTTESKLMQITGYVGAVADGTVRISYDDVVIETKVSSGAFSVDLPSDVTTAVFTAEVTKTVGSTKYGYTGYAEANALTDDSIVNINVTNDDSILTYTDDLDARLDLVSFSGGVAKVGVTVFNNTDTTQTYVITSGSAWDLDGSVIVTVAANSSMAVNVNGHYEQHTLGIGSYGATITVADFNGVAKSKTIDIIAGTTDGSTDGITMTVAKDEGSINKDRISGSEYMYALTFKNEGAAAKVTIDAEVDGDYGLALMGADGAIIADSPYDFVIPAKNTAVVYVKVMAKVSTMTDVPEVTVTTSLSGDAKTLTPSSIDLTVDSMTVSGDKAVDQKSGIPLGVWFIFGISILLLILIVWMGSKRGVFSRK